jgi:hypothetical protein
MQSEKHKGYVLWSHAILQAQKYAASGTITKDNRVIEASGVLDDFATEEEAETAGLAWARAWVDNHG